MKLKDRDRSIVYDRLYVLARKVLAQGKCCVTCPIKRRKMGWRSEERSKSWCCSGCPHLGPQGCTVQALACSLWLCGSKDSRRYSRGHVSRAQQRLDKIVLIAQHYQIHVARASKEQSLEYGPSGDFWVVYHQHH